MHAPEYPVEESDEIFSAFGIAIEAARRRTIQHKGYIFASPWHRQCEHLLR